MNDGSFTVGKLDLVPTVPIYGAERLLPHLRRLALAQSSAAQLCAWVGAPVVKALKSYKFKVRVNSEFV